MRKKSLAAVPPVYGAARNKQSRVRHRAGYRESGRGARAGDLPETDWAGIRNDISFKNTVDMRR